ncbi:TetR/AcrR family transcriptional regulator [Microscilla marina]|uniref:Hypothetical transcriptional regulator n=1 Tax=Microscilla marina ATCC 23134 TaxID=313606 RepID=A2A050_MICM2|nr:TetR/AcrR family transcriptional regulator [Microscilla marina]EAY23988.1 hypothetical transcriptional regulator [Microscilla marina ATCC 23134]
MSSNTKERILDKATELFNEQGITNTSIRNIADALEMSPGNITYHFKSKEEIVQHIQERNFQNIQSVLAQSERVGLEHFDKILDTVMIQQQRSRCFFSDTMDLVRNYPSIAQKLAQNITKNLKTARVLFDYYIGRGLLKPERTEGAYDHLIHSILLVCISWLKHQTVMATNDVHFSEEYFLGMLRSMFIPHLTEKGLKEYEALHRKKASMNDHKA